MAKVGVLISGCGFMDGAEVHESVLTLLYLVKAGHEVVPIAPNIDQRRVVDHRSGDEKPGETRNVAEESARIFRTAPVCPRESPEIDALVLPGGFGAALNLSDFAINGPDGSVHADSAALVRKMIAAGKPVGAWCIAPAVLGKMLDGNPAVKLTIGTDEDTAAAVEKTGAKHVNAAAVDCVVDEANKVVTTPAYMNAANIDEVAQGIEKAVAVLSGWLK